MKVLFDSSDKITQDSVCAIGSFDGVHRGHQAIVDTVRQIAGSTLRTGIITFLPLPFFVLKDISPMYLTVRSEKERLFTTLDVDFIYYFTFDRTFAALEPGVFIDRLSDSIGPRHIVVGSNFHFGSARSGSAQGLVDLAKGRFDVHIVQPIKDNGVISSTRIRELLLLGNVVAANRLLGREYSLTGRVIKGRGRGAKLGFPTVNVRAAKDKLLPLDGIYAARVPLNGKRFNGALFLRHDLVEVHLLDYGGVLYDQDLEINFVKRVRSIGHFPDDRALIDAIAHDISHVRGYFAGRKDG
jgi:riboflavin kinase/FMN adenylyltransferase